MPAHWLAENLERETPTPFLPPTSMAAATGSHAVATSAPYLITVSTVFKAIPDTWFLIPLTFSTFLCKVSPGLSKKYCLFGTLSPYLYSSTYTDLFL